MSDEKTPWDKFEEDLPLNIKVNEPGLTTKLGRLCHAACLEYSADLKAENEQLKVQMVQLKKSVEEIIDDPPGFDRLIEELDQLKVENERLKREKDNQYQVFKAITDDIFAAIGDEQHTNENINVGVRRVIEERNALREQMTQVETERLQKQEVFCEIVAQRNAFAAQVAQLRLTVRYNHLWHVDYDDEGYEDSDLYKTNCDALAATTAPAVVPANESHAGDCTIYRAMINQNPTDGICTCGYGWEQVRKGDWSKMFSEERKDHALITVPASDILVVLAGARVPTPEKGYTSAEQALNDLRRVLYERVSTSDILVVLAGAGVPTPKEGYASAEHALNDLRRALHERIPTSDVEPLVEASERSHRLLESDAFWHEANKALAAYRAKYPKQSAT